MLERLIYRSIASQPMGNLHLCNLLASARRANAQRQVTGHLAYQNGTFLQCLEGPVQAIAQLWDNLQADTRHHSLNIVDRHDIGSRRFHEWSMAFSSPHYQNTYALPGFFWVQGDPMDALMGRLGLSEQRLTA
jgi:hypothetical protein